MLYIACNVLRDSLADRNHFVSDFGQMEIKGKNMLEFQVYLSVASLSFNDACRAAMIDAIFFSDTHSKL